MFFMSNVKGQLITLIKTYLQKENNRDEVYSNPTVNNFSAILQWTLEEDTPLEKQFKCYYIIFRSV